MGKQAAGEKQGRKPWTLREVGGKTIWDWLQLLIVPVVLSLITVAFAWQQDIRQDQIENKRAKAEREVGKQRAQDEALQAYLNQIGSLLLEKDLRESKEDSEERTLARARTLTVLGRLDPSRKTAVMEFLVEAELVQRVEGRRPIIRLGGANLSGAVLSDPDAVSPGCGLSCYYPDQVTNLRGADLAFANLTNTQMYMVDLRDANLNGANLGDAFLRGAFLKDANLRDANLSDAGLLGANLSGADLHGADSSDARLKDANLSGADLSYADLSHAKGMSNEELEQETSSLGRATMPDGQRHKSVTTEFVTTEFEPAFSISLSEEWEIGAGQERSHSISISNPDQGELFFTNPLHVFDPSEPSAQKELPAPENAEEWLSWFQRHPNLDTSKPVPVRVGSASGKQIDVTYASTPENFVELYPLSDEIFIAVYEGYKDRFVIVDVQGETVLIDVGASPDKFDEFFPKAQKVLDTVEWKGE